MIKSYRHKYYFFFIFALSALMINYKAYAAEKSQTVFMESAESGKILYDKKTHTSTLELKNLEPWVIYFNQKPQYTVKFMTLQDFTDFMDNQTETSFSQGLSADLMSLSPQEDKTQQQELILSHPQYDSKNKIMRFTVLSTEPPKNNSSQSISFKNGMLFIQFCAECAGRGV